MSKLKLGLVGFGNWGKRHYNVWSRHADIELRAIYDPRYSNSTPSLDSLIENVDVVDVVVPAESLADVASKAILAGRHTFIEKPMASSLPEARKIEGAAKENPDITVMVGFIERFNPVFRKIHFVTRTLKKPLRIFCQRSGTPTLVAQKTGVLKDLAIHDVDLLRWMLGEPRRTVIRSMERFHFGQLELKFEDGTEAMIISDCLGPKVRRWVLEFEDRIVYAFFEENRWRLFADNAEVPIAWKPPLEKELNSFISSVKEKVHPTPSIRDGVKALETIEEAIEIKTIL